MTRRIPDREYCRTRSRSRRGALVVCVLVCLLVASAIVTATTRMALRSRRDVRTEHQMRQTLLMLDAGILRAARRVQASPDYQGESWRPTAAITSFEGAKVEIRVTVDEQQDDTRRVEVTASLGVAVEDARQKTASLTRRSHTFPIKIPTEASTAE